MPSIEMREFAALAGKEIGVSRWFEIGQRRINEFADVTEDWQFIHVDPKQAAETPFGGTVAHGFLTLSMLPAMAYDAMPSISGRVMAVNYGFDKIRFVAPVRSGSRVRAKFKLLEVTPRNPMEFMSKSEVFVEIEGSEKPTLTAEWLGISYFWEPIAV